MSVGPFRALRVIRTDASKRKFLATRHRKGRSRSGDAAKETVVKHAATHTA